MFHYKERRRKIVSEPILETILEWYDMMLSIYIDRNILSFHVLDDGIKNIEFLNLFWFCCFLFRRSCFCCLGLFLSFGLCPGGHVFL